MIRLPRTNSQVFLLAVSLVALLLAPGCGTINRRDATDQLLVSDAVDATISQFDFGPLSNAKVFLDTRYVRRVNSVGFVNSDYIISALRERMVLAGCLLQDKSDDADYVVELRIGALGTDGHEVNYGIPGNNAITATTSLVGGPAMPPLPELSLARKDERRAAVKVGLFAYHRETREPVWQPGMVQGNSIAKATWVLGAGPFHEGKIYHGSQMGSDLLGVPELPVDAPAIASLLPWRRDYEPEPQEVQVEIPETSITDVGPQESDTETSATPDPSAQASSA